MKSLWAKGWSHQVSSFSQETRAGVAIISRHDIQPGNSSPCPQDGRWLHVRIPHEDLEVCGAYAPLSDQLKGEFWDWMTTAARPLLSQRAIVLGDLNNGLFPADHPADARPLPKWTKMQDLLDSGWTDLYRHLHPTGSDSSWWTNRGAGFRIDHAFGSQKLCDGLNFVDYVTSIENMDRPLVDKLGAREGWTRRASSDHAVLRVTLDAASRT